MSEHSTPTLSMLAYVCVCGYRPGTVWLIIKGATQNLLSSSDKQVVATSTEGQCIDWTGALHGRLATTDSLFASDIPNHNTK